MLHIQGYSAQLIKPLQYNIHWNQETLSNIKSLDDLKTLVTDTSSDSEVFNNIGLYNNYNGLCIYKNNDKYPNDKGIKFFNRKLPSYISMTFYIAAKYHGYLSVFLINKSNDSRIPVSATCAANHNASQNTLTLNGVYSSNVGSQCGWKHLKTGLNAGQTHTIEWYRDDVYECDTFYQTEESTFTIAIDSYYQPSINSSTRYVIQNLLIEF